MSVKIVLCRGHQLTRIVGVDIRVGDIHQNDTVVRQLMVVVIETEEELETVPATYTFGDDEPTTMAGLFKGFKFDK